MPHCLAKTFIYFYLFILFFIFAIMDELVLIYYYYWYSIDEVTLSGMYFAHLMNS